MARFYYQCNFDLKNDTTTDGNVVLKPFVCPPDKHCLYCCCNQQCCIVVQKRPLRHVWENWYFWLGIAFIAVFIISSVCGYVINNYKHNIQGVPFQHNAPVSPTNRPNEEISRERTNQNEISINIIPASELLIGHRKMVIISSQPTVTHMTPVVA